MEDSLKQYVIGLDMGGTHIRVGAVTEEGTLHYFSKVKTKDVMDPLQPIESLANFVKNYIDSYIVVGQVVAVGIGFPSVVSKDKKSIYSTPNLNYLSNINIVDPLQELVKMPVFINRDVNFLMQYELSQRELDREEIVLGFYIGTGFGNAIYLNQQFLEGKNGAAGELGHIPVLHNDVVCGCGNVGCIEGVASGKKLVSIHQEFFREIPFEEIFVSCSNEPIIDEFLQALAIPIAAELNIFDPYVVILGGGVVGMRDFPKKRLEEYIIKYTRKPVPAEGITFEYALDTCSAGVLGAASYIYEKLRNKTVQFM
jgi:allose kinase